VVFYGVAAVFIGGFGAWLRFSRHAQQCREAWDREREAWLLGDREDAPNPFDLERDGNR
jgi:hypothetical protein